MSITVTSVPSIRAHAFAYGGALAQDMGYYKQAGLNVTLNYDKLPNPPQAVADRVSAAEVATRSAKRPA